MAAKIRKRSTAPPPRERARRPPSDEKYLQALQAAERYIAAVQACIDGDGRLQKNRTARRIGPNSLLRTLCISGLVSPGLRKLSPRAQLLYLLRANVGYKLVVREHPGPSLLINIMGPAERNSMASASPHSRAS